MILTVSCVQDNDELNMLTCSYSLCRSLVIPCILYVQSLLGIALTIKIPYHIAHSFQLFVVKTSAQKGKKLKKVTSSIRRVIHDFDKFSYATTLIISFTNFLRIQFSKNDDELYFKNTFFFFFCKQIISANNYFRTF